MIINPESYEFASARGFLVLEGVDGSGKTTLQRKIAALVESSGRACISTREPGATVTGKGIRQLVLHPSGDSPTPRTELLLFAADRAEHVDRIIRPALDERKAVVSDRYYYSTAAFQGYGRQLDRELVEQVNRSAIDGMIPDLVILLDLDPEIGLKRAASRGSEKLDAIESEKLEFHRRLRFGFLQIAKSYDEPFLLVDASKDEDAVWDACKLCLEKWISRLQK